MYTTGVGNESCHLNEALNVKWQWCLDYRGSLMAKQSIAGSRICISAGSHIIKWQKVSPCPWEGMFAIYFPLLTELLKYTTLEVKAHRQWGKIERQTISQILGIGELVELCWKYYHGSGLAHLAHSLSSQLCTGPRSQKEKPYLTCIHIYRFFSLIFFMSK